MKRLSQVNGMAFRPCKLFTGMALGALLVGGWVQAQTAPPITCAAATYRDFDFWLGDWQVLKADGNVAGQNRIVAVENGCVVHERYQTPGGYTGQSFTLYDASRKRWHQTWVDNQGALLLLEGGLQNGNMVLEGSVQGTPNRITWSPLADGQVRQHWQVKQGESWTTVFDGYYRKQAPDN